MKTTVDQPGTILIIDDDPRNIFALSAFLKARGFEVTDAPGMKAAFTKIHTNPGINVLLLDMMMPEMDGYEALQVLTNNEKYQHLKVIAVTAQAMSGDREKCLQAGAADYLSKPVDIDALVALLNKIQGR